MSDDIPLSSQMLQNIVDSDLICGATFAVYLAKANCLLPYYTGLRGRNRYKNVFSQTLLGVSQPSVLDAEVVPTFVCQP